MSNTILVIQFFTFIFNLFLGFLVIFKNPRSLISWNFWILAISIACWNLSLFLTISGFGQSLLWGRLAFSFGALMPMGFSLFALSFPQRERFFWPKAVPAVLPALFFFVISLTRFFIKDVQVVNRLYVTGTFTPLFQFYMLFSLSFLALPFIDLFYKYFYSSGIRRMQLKYVIAGILSFFIPLFLTQLVLPLFGVFKFNNLGPLFSIPMISMIMYAITRYRFLDIRLVIQRSVFYLILITFATALYVLLLALAQIFLIPRTGSILSSVITSLFIVYGYPRFKEFFHKKTDKIFFKGTYDYWETLGHLSQALVSGIDLSRLLEKIGQVMKNDFKASFISYWSFNRLSNKFVFVYGTGDAGGNTGILNENPEEKVRALKDEIIVCEELEYRMSGMNEKNRKLYGGLMKMAKQSDVAVFAPIFYQSSLMGVFLIGKKLSHDPFVKKDIRLLTIFARHAGAVFNSAELYEEIKNYNLTLEAKVEDRTQELKRLFDAQSRFLADISHELQTPLSIIKGNMLALSREKELKKHKKTFEIVDETLNNASSLLNNLMALARLDFEQGKFSQEPMSMKKLLEEVYESFGPLVLDKGIAFNLEILADGEFTIAGNYPLLKQLFLNLLSNAVKFTQKGGGIRIIIEEDGQSVTVSVEDTGAGISEKDRPFIFERFYQATNGDFKRGVGLGLAICKKIADWHNASISVSSKEGEGSRFAVTFPRIYKENV